MQLQKNAGVWATVVATAASASCDVDPSGEPDTRETSRSALTNSPQARARIEALRERFSGTTGAYDSAVIGAGLASAFESSGMTRESVQVVIPKQANRGLARTASVELPLSAAGFARLEDVTSRLSVRFALQGATDVPIAVADGIALYNGALHGADVVHRVHAEGTEDFVVFEQRPEREELRYTVDVSHVAGLRLVSNTLEFIDEGGAPRLRVAPPYVVDADGERHAATLAMEGCGYDENPAAPWGRPVARPGADGCTLRITWPTVRYPAVMDPAWTTAGSPLAFRIRHTASVLASGEVLLVGGDGTPSMATAELYDPVAMSFAATGSMMTPRYNHTASRIAGGKVLVTGGAGAATAPTTAELYDPATGTFSPTGSMAEARYDHTASLLASGKVLVAGGITAELYDPDLGVFSATGTMAEPRGGHTASVLASGEVLIAGGRLSTQMNGGVDIAELYDPGAGTFGPTGSMLQGRWWHTASVLPSGKVLVTGGRTGAYDTFATAELYDPATGEFSPTGPMVEPRNSHTASVLQSGEVLIAGGYQKPVYFKFASAELYDPELEAFSLTVPMAKARYDHTATVLESGNVLVADGHAELYVPSTSAGAGGSGTGGVHAGGASQGGDASQGGGGAPEQGGGGTATADGDALDGGGCSCSEARFRRHEPMGMFAIALAVGAWMRRRAKADDHRKANGRVAHASSPGSSKAPS